MKSLKVNYFKKNKIFLIKTISIGVFFAPSFVLAQAVEPWAGAYTTQAFANGAIRNLYCDLVNEVESSFGALQFIAGAFGIFGYAAFGDYKKTYGLIISGIVAATMSTGISLYFGTMCGENTNARVKYEDTAISEEKAVNQKSFSDSANIYSEPANVEEDDESSSHDVF
jgi:hypothetical protein